MNNIDYTLALRQMTDHLVAEAAALEPYDALVWAGYPACAFQVWPDAAAVGRGLEASPIRRALISHTVGGMHDATAGNQALAALLEALPGGYGVMTLVPETAHDEPVVERRIAVALRRGMRAARILPKSHRYTLKTPGVDRLLEALEARRVPLFIPIGQTDWNEIGTLALAHAGLAILVESAGHHEYLNMRAALPWLEKAANLLVPTNRQFLAGGLELLVERLGPERVLFASGQPIEDPWSTLALLVKSRLPEAARRLIAHGNLERLLEAVVVEDSEE